MQISFSKTEVLNFIYNIICALVALSAETGHLDALGLSGNARHDILLACAVATFLKSHWNIFISPPSGGGNDVRK